jgi:hypothetical protein
MRMNDMNSMEILHMTRGINDVSFQPELIMVIRVPLAVVDTTDMARDEEDKLLGGMIREAVERYNGEKKNG